MHPSLWFLLLIWATDALKQKTGLVPAPTRFQTGATKLEKQLGTFLVAGDRASRRPHFTPTRLFLCLFFSTAMK